jgi:hypothetical protein
MRVKENQKILQIFNKDGSINIIAILKIIWQKRIFISKATISFFFIGCLFALLSPEVYTSETTFVPQVTDDSSSANNKLGSLASLAGINLNPKETTDSYLSPLVYIKIVDSEEFSLRLLNEEIINSKGEKLTIKQYLLPKKSFFNFNPIKFIKKYTIGLFLINKPNEIKGDKLENYNFISDVDYGLIRFFRSKYSIELNEKEGYIKVIANDKDPFISSQFVIKITKSLQSKIIEIRTNKINEGLEFSKEQYQLKQDEFDILQIKLAQFKDSNKSISTASFRSELQKLESEYQLQQNILINLASEYNNNKIKLNKDTPIFSVIDEVTVPNQRSKPNRKIIVLIFVFLGFFLTVFITVVKEPLLVLIKKITE